MYKVRRKADDQIYALKSIRLDDLSESEKKNALGEIQLLASIRHENIVSYKDAFIGAEKNTLCIVMEYMDGGDLSHIIQKHTSRGSFIPE